MNKTRLEAFSDGVIAIIITIMVLELHAPHAIDWHGVSSLGYIAASYLLSFIYVGIYWNNHHHLLHAASTINGKVMWSNLNLLFWLSLIPFTTSWVGESSFEAIPVALYGIIILMTSLSFHILQIVIMQDCRNHALREALGRDIKGKITPILLLLAIGSTFINVVASGFFHLVVLLIWAVPDRRIERNLTR